MYRNTILAAVLALVMTGIARAELLAHWKFDEGSGTMIQDSSGNGHDGVISGTPEWGPGPFGGALTFRNTVGVEVPNFDPTGGTGSFSLTFWSNWDGVGGIQHFFTKSNGWNISTMMFQVECKGLGNSDPARDRRLHLACHSFTQAVLHEIPTGEWAHNALVYDGATGTATGYLNGVDESGPKTTGIGTPLDCPVLIGVAQPLNRVFQGSLDDMRLFDRVLSQAEIMAIVAGEGEEDLSAYGPTPADGSLQLETWCSLSWRAGPKAVSHNVYLGDNFDAVNEGTTGTFLGNQTATSVLVGFPGYPIPDGMVPGTTYYWRVDEVNDAEPNSPWRGDVWSFSIAPKTAYSPNPPDGAEFVDVNTILSWTGGYGSRLHAVYIGESFEQVANASGGTLMPTTSYNPGPLEREKVFYWRVDEFDGVETHKGNLWSFTTPGAVGNPLPANTAVDVSMTPTLTWTAADNASSQQVYFGMDREAVRNATTASAEYKGNKAKGSESYDPAKLDWATAYYWRVDAVYSTGTVKGLVWSFTTADFISVDDFESYNDIDPPDPASNRIFDSWLDGFGTTTNGSLVGNNLPPYAEQGVAHGGAQSMPYRYDSNLKTSEASKTLIYPRDWTEGGVTRLSLWFRGGSANAAEQMYIALNNSAVVYHDDAGATQVPRWTQWVIDLQSFANQGVNLANVNTLTIGLGTKGSPTAGGQGKMYFDDIRLYRPVTP